MKRTIKCLECHDVVADRPHCECNGSICAWCCDCGKATPEELREYDLRINGPSCVANSGRCAE